MTYFHGGITSSPYLTRACSSSKPDLSNAHLHSENTNSMPSSSAFLLHSASTSSLNKSTKTSKGVNRVNSKIRSTTCVDLEKTSKNIQKVQKKEQVSLEHHNNKNTSSKQQQGFQLFSAKNKRQSNQNSDEKSINLVAKAENNPKFKRKTENRRKKDEEQISGEKEEKEQVSIQVQPNHRQNSSFLKKEHRNSSSSSSSRCFLVADHTYRRHCKLIRRVCVF